MAGWLSPKINNIAKMGENRPKVSGLTGALGIIFYIINDVKKVDVWGERRVSRGKK
jgi:hypothetical protein